jgi:predicted DCC family thiol-disulfide oxidoreductase YuxK
MPYQEAPAPPMTPELYAACDRAVHLVLPDGTLLRAGRAVLYMLEKAGWGWTARVLAWPPLVWLVELGYRIVADNRAFFSRFLFRRE